MSSDPNAVPRSAADLLDLFGHIDVYLFDQLLRGRVTPEMRILDAGCGRGRNAVYLLRAGADYHAVDADPDAVRTVRELAHRVAPALADGDDRFRVAHLEKLPHEERSFDAVISNAVLHFAKDDDHFDAMVDELWRVLRPGGVLFTRLASTISVDSLVRPLGKGRFAVPDGSERYLVDEERLLHVAARLGASHLDPIKTTNVQNQRAMTTWVVRKE